MKANDYIKKNGFEAAKKILSFRDGFRGFITLTDGSSLHSDELKELVESHELVAIHGYEKSKEIVTNAPSGSHCYSWKLGNSGVRDKTVNIGELRKALNDVESCGVLM